VIINEVMGHQKLNITLNAICLAIFLSIAIVFPLMNMVLGYILSAAFFAGSLYKGYYFYLLLWLHNWGLPFSEEKKQKIEQVRKQMHD
jgi:hypothetical protein